MIKRLSTDRLRDLATVAAMLAVVVAVFFFAQSRDTSFQLLTANGVSYPSATVTRVVSEDLTPEEGTGRYLGCQTLEVRIESGEFAGETVEAANSISADHNVLGRVGERVIIKAERQEGVTPYYSVFNYDRILPSAGILIAFAVCMVVVGGLKGARSMIGLAFALYMVVCFLLPAIFSGLPAIPMGLITMVVITVFSMLLLNGWSEKTYAAIASTVLGLLAAMAVYLAFSALLRVSGFNQGSAEELIIISRVTGLDVQQTLFVGVLVASLGAVMDMCMSIAASLFELREQDPGISRRQIMVSAFNVGRDMIGTMSQTLILAFTGSSLTSLLVLVAYGVEFTQLISSDYMAIELLHSFVGGIAVVLCVPIVAVICALVAVPQESAKPDGDGRASAA